jgi:hypothetical protein
LYDGLEREPKACHHVPLGNKYINKYTHTRRYIGLYANADICISIHMKFVSKISKQGDDLIIKIPRDKANLLKPLHGKPMVITVDSVEGVE